ncbi:MAG: hypothetical protein RLZZ584_1389 [Pseudomonadota bacterium]
MSSTQDLCVLAVNAGSATLKFALYPVHGVTARDAAGGASADAAIASGSYDGLQPRSPGDAERAIQLDWRGADGQRHRFQLACANPTDAANSTGVASPFAIALAHLPSVLAQALPAGVQVAAVAHRIVHGGGRFSDSVLLDDATLAQLEAYTPLAPLHQPHNLHGVRAFLATTAPGLAGLPQIGCFDTGFHATLPREETMFALPADEPDLTGVQRYGFHGLSYRWLAASLPCLEPERHAGRWLLCHLGSGASLCAIQGGHSIATTMGFSALDGLMMGTRCGALDPGVLLHLLRAGWSADRLEKLLYKDSGLAGVSGISADMRTLRASSDPRAGRAISLFTHRVLRESGALIACMGGLDGIVYTGGIGEHDIEMRAELSQGLAHLGVHIDAERNAAATGDAPTAIHDEGSRIAVWVIPTDEGRVAAGDAAAWLLRQAQG